MTPSEIETHLHRLLAKEQITDALLAYARGADRLDYDLIRDLFHPDAVADYGDMFQGTGYGFADFIAEVHPPMETHTHHLSNITIALDPADPDRAGSETYVIVRLRSRDSDGVAHDTLSHGRYVDRWERREATWRVAHRRYLHALDSITEPGVTLFPVTGTRDATDPSYEALA